VLTCNGVSLRATSGSAAIQILTGLLRRAKRPPRNDAPLQVNTLKQPFFNAMSHVFQHNEENRTLASAIIVFQRQEPMKKTRLCRAVDLKWKNVYYNPCMDVTESRKRILIIDDSKTQLGFFKIHFNNAGYEVETASEAREAFVKIFEFRPDLVLSDVVMDTISGFQLCKILKKNIVLKKIPIILFTSSMDVISNAFWAKKAQADIFISKNADIKDIIACANEISEKNPVDASVKIQLAENAVRAGNLFDENKLTSDNEWMREIIIQEFRNFGSFAGSTQELMKKLYEILSLIFNYDLCFIMLNKQDANFKPTLYADTNYYRAAPEVLDMLSKEFTQEIFGEDKSANIVVTETNIRSEEIISDASCYNKGQLIIPISDSENIYGAIGLYYEPSRGTRNASYFDDVINELSALIKNKIVDENLNFISYNNPALGIYNRFQFLDTLSIELARTKLNNSSVSVVIFAFENYDDISSRFGADIANIAVQKAVQLVTSSLRFPDKVYRYNHQSLLMILANVNAAQAKIPMMRINEQLREFKLNINNADFEIKTKTVIIDNHAKYKDADDLFFSLQNLFENFRPNEHNRILVYNETTA